MAELQPVDLTEVVAVDLVRERSVAHHLEKVIVTGYGPFPYQVDGDYLGEVESLEFTWESEVLRLVVP